MNDEILREIAERYRQASLAAIRPPGTSGHNFRREADSANRSLLAAERGGGGTWFHVARARFWTAMSKTDSVKLRDALVSLAAVIVAWIEDIDRKAS